MEIKRVILILMCLLVSGCGFSAREHIIRSRRPEHLKNYTEGLIAKLSQNDIEEAIEFGKENKHKQDVINYAFMFSKDSTRFTELVSRKIYVLVCTNYYLIADYASQQARNYEEIDMEYVNYLANLSTFKLEVIEQINNQYLPYQLNAKSVLFKDETKKIKETEIGSLYKNKNPYYESHFDAVMQNFQKLADDSVKKSIEMANSIAKAYQKQLDIDVENVAIDTQSKISNVYKYEDIDLSSKYALAIIFENREKRIPLDFLIIK